MKRKTLYKWIIIFIIIATIILFVYFHEKEFRIKTKDILRQNTNVTKFNYFAFSGQWSKDFEIYSATKVNITYFFKPFFGKATIQVIRKNSDSETKNKIVFNSTSPGSSEKSLTLRQDSYSVKIKYSWYTGSGFISLQNTIYSIQFPNNNFKIIKGQNNKGFYWDYILYIPDKISYNTILVAPNFSSVKSNNIELHAEEAKRYTITVSSLSKKLKIPLLVPIFPLFIDNIENTNIQTLDRSTFIVNKNSFSKQNSQRYDLQLIAMIQHAKDHLLNENIKTNDTILLYGFGKPGEFVDRFTHLHPAIVKAAIIGGCQIMLPLESLEGEKLPYPIGIYDYKDLTGYKYDLTAFSRIKRFLFMGNKDEGDFVKNDKTTNKITEQNYFNLYDKVQVEQFLSVQPIPIFNGETLSKKEENAIRYRIFQGKTFFEAFMSTESIFNFLQLTRNDFNIDYYGKHEASFIMKYRIFYFLNKILLNSKK